MHFQDSASQALNLPEIMFELSQYLTVREIATAIRVCRSWHSLLRSSVFREVCVSYEPNTNSEASDLYRCVPPTEALQTYSHIIRSLTIVGRPNGRGKVEYFGLRRCFALERFVWRSMEPARNLITKCQGSTMIKFIEANRMRLKTIAIEHSNTCWVQFWDTFVRNPIPSLKSLSCRKIEVTEDSVYYFWGVCHDLETLEIGYCKDLGRSLRPIYNDPKAAAKALQTKLDDGIQTNPNLEWLASSEVIMFPKMKVLKLPEDLDSDSWSSLMEQCPRLEAWW